MIASILPVPTFSCSGEHTMFGPGEYVPDPTEGIVDIKDLPRPQLVAYSRNHEHTPCPRCDHLAYRHKCGQRTLHDLGDLSTGCPVDHRVIDLAVRLVVEDGLPYRPTSWHLWRDHRVFVPFATIQNWAEAGGKKGPRADGRSVPRLGA